MSETSPNDEAMTDRVWRGYDVRAMIPPAAIAGVISLLLLVGRWLSDDLSDFAERIGSLVLFAPVLLMWLILIAIGLYRTVTYTYRLTDQALLVDRGFRSLPEPRIELSEVAEAQVSFEGFGKWLGVGQVSVTTRTGRILEMTGVYDPAGFAAAIREAAGVENEPSR